ncbi:hypothetical protein DFJ43DRAFT_1037205 [Lentinula guzmanii]|uniref:Chromatin elongation factor SPT5 n=1 Tax=Lentinula guzmanii TaxID=2804957 RepID=A0AA38JYR2_9AGAR|nr:hypothetical protein DFJ43DRAFT_1037205 [Lentinula guzmanii]
MSSSHIQEARKRKRSAKSFILDEAEVYDDEDEDEDEGEAELSTFLDEAEVKNDDDFQNNLAQFRRYKKTSKNPSIFSDLITRVESSTHSQQPSDPNQALSSAKSPRLASSSSNTLRASDLNEEDSLDDGHREHIYRLIESVLYESPDAPDFIAKYLIYHVRCHLGKEKAIIRRIQDDIIKYDQKKSDSARHIQDVFPSKFPGYIYLMTLNAHDQSPLCEYLHSFSSFLYDRSTTNRKHNFMPIHHLVTNFSPPFVVQDEPKFSEGDWVVITAQPDIYTGDLGLIIPDDERLPNLPNRSYTVVTVPRTPRSLQEEKSFTEDGTRPAPCILSFADAHRVADLYKLEQLEHWGEDAHPEWGQPIQNNCPAGSSCPKDHSFEFGFRGQIFQCGLVLLTYRESGLSPAPPSIDASMLHPLITSHHPFVYRGLRKMPIPSTWSFRIGDNVATSSDGAIGVITSVLDRTCEVDFNGDTQSIPILNLIKHFAPGDIVYNSNNGDSGTLLAVNGYHAVVILDERTVSVRRNQKQAESNQVRAPQRGYLLDDENASRPQGQAASMDSVVSIEVNSLVSSSRIVSSSSTATSSRVEPIFSVPIDSRTRISPWVGIRVIVVQHRARHGYRGVVVDVQRSKESASGLIVRVKYDVLNLSISEGVEWLDFIQVRNEQSLRFLHDSPQSGIDSYHSFKHGFVPTYTPVEIEAILQLDAANRDVSLQERIEADDLALRREHVHELATIPIPPSDQWILDPRWQASLGKLEFWIQIHHGTWASTQDQKVRLELSNGHLQVRIRLGATNTRDRDTVVPVTDICNVPPNGVRTQKVKARAYDARGLFLVAFPDEGKIRYMGNLVRRITGGEAAGMYVVQRVSVDPILARVGFREFLTNDPPFEIHFSALLLVHMSETLNKVGNKLMYDLRVKYGGHVNQSDKPDGRIAKKARKEKNLSPNSMEDVDNSGGRTPLWPPGSTAVEDGPAFGS